MNSFAPIIIFAYKRVDTLKQTIDSLKKCIHADESEVIIFSDGASGQSDFQQVDEVRKYLKELNGFKSLKINYSDTHKQLANSIISGVTEVFNQYEQVIVLEDDLIASVNFLEFMNEALDKYRQQKMVFSISGYSIPIKVPLNYPFDVYFTPRASSWGWATWKDRWNGIDWLVKDYSEFKKSRKQISEFNKGGSDLSNMLTRQMNGKLDSWAIRWCYHEFKMKTLTVYPVISKIQNIGFSTDATHSNGYNRYKTPLDTSLKSDFKFIEDVKLHPGLFNQFRHFFSMRARILNYLKNIFYLAGILSNNNGGNN